MLLFQNNSVNTNTTTANLKEQGTMTLKDIKSIPMFNLRYKGIELNRFHPEVCGSEGGDCFKFI